MAYSGNDLPRVLNEAARLNRQAALLFNVAFPHTLGPATRLETTHTG